MKVLIDSNVYEMSQTSYKGILETASKFVPCGVYAVEKDDFAELKKDKCKSATELKKIVSEYKKKGFKVYCNK